ncbi:MAG: methyl-accepting chemotaxis protein [Candidatus Cloacimonetes bacterium]|nr:methyl-accepting chemotaxis protein [Candidatus Cloacimonadota bacterium]
MNISKKIFLLLTATGIIGLVVIAFFFSYSLQNNMMNDVKASAADLIGRSVQMFVVSTVKFHKEFNAAKTKLEKKEVHDDWIRTIIAVDSAIIHDFGKDKTRIRLVTDKKLLKVRSFGGIATKAETSFEMESLRDFLKGKTFTEDVTDNMYRRSIPLYSDAHPGCAECHSIPVSDHKLLGSLNIYIPLQEKFEKIKEIGIYNLLVIFIIGGVLCGVLLVLIKKIVLNPIHTLEETSNVLASSEGDLTTRLPVNSTDEIGKASHEVNLFIEKVQHTIIDVKDSSFKNTEIASSLVNTAGIIERGVDQSISTLVNVSQEAEVIQETLEDLVVTSQQARDNIFSANQTLDMAKSNVLDLAKGVQSNAKLELEFSKKLNKLSGDTEQVKSVLAVISSIAHQTNLLALNAAIEAARAGRHGLGFAVVSEEVKNLANRSQSSLVEIDEIISNIVESILAISVEMNDNIDNINKLTSLSSDVEDAIVSTSNIMTSSTQIVEDSFANSEAVAKNTLKLISQIESVNEINKEYVFEVDEIVKASTTINEFAEQLREELNKFKTD